MANYEITEVRLLNVPLENDYIHSLYFSSRSTQADYFKSKTIDTMGNSSYQRKDKKIRWDNDFDDVIGANYVMYKNRDKWYYAFITNIEYVNEGVTDIYIETDVIQTWLFDYTINTSFIEREHVDDDTVGLHTLPEQLETGEYIKNKNGIELIDDNLRNINDNSYIIVAVSEYMNSDGDFEPVAGDYYGGAYSGLKYIPFSTPDLVNTFITEYDTAGKGDAINSVFMCPGWLVTLNSDGQFASSKNAVTWEVSANKPTAIDGYTPTNKKLLCFPYSYLLVTNNQGSNAILHNEKFANNSRVFTTFGTVTPGCSVRTVPMNYNGIETNVDEGLNLGKYPICNWNSDVFTNWLTQNGVNVGLQILTAGASIAGGIGMIATGAGAVIGGGMIAGGVGSILNTAGQMYQHNLTPPQAEGNVNCGDVMYAMNRTTFTYIDMCVKKEYARVIDNYFNMFGYKVNRVKKPNKNHRRNYWYTKTIDVNITGAIPMEDMRKIKECYNRGITFWKNPSNIKNYDVDNSIV